MSSGTSRPRVIPARVRVGELAEALNHDVEEIQAVLAELGESVEPQELLDSEVSLFVARELGEEVVVETRDLALELLYQAEMGIDVEGDEIPGRLGALVRGVLATKEDLDHEIESASEHWSIARMPVVDRTILRLGLYELRNFPETPPAVVVSEAVRLASSYSTEKSGVFVNGVLASLARSHAE